MGVEIEQVIGAIPEWAGRHVTFQEIVGGLTNRNYRVEIDGEPVFVRVPGDDTELLAVDRGNELANSRAAAQAGVGPRVLHHLAAWDVMVLEWLPGRTLSNEACLEPDMPERIAGVLRRLHAGPRFRDDFDMVPLSARYLRLVDERAFPIPAGYRAHMRLIPRIAAALAAQALATVPCHNDLLAANYLDDGERLWIVDYEYSGNADPTFELGNTCQELGWDAMRVEALCTAYFGRANEALLARMRLQMIMSDVGWSLWAAIQASVSAIEYDFWGWAEERWSRAAAAMDDDDFERWLRQASRD